MNRHRHAAVHEFLYYLIHKQLNYGSNKNPPICCTEFFSNVNFIIVPLTETVIEELASQKHQIMCGERLSKVTSLIVAIEFAG
jgi:hypothetical protein